MADIMSQNEIDELLKQLTGGADAGVGPVSQVEPSPSPEQAAPMPPPNIQENQPSMQQQPGAGQQYPPQMAGQQYPQQMAVQPQMQQAMYPQQYMQQPMMGQQYPQQMMGQPGMQQMGGYPPQYMQQEHTISAPVFNQLQPAKKNETPGSGQTVGASMLAALKAEKGNKKIKPYDFRRPDKFVKEQLRTITKIHENFSRTVTTSLSAMLRSMVSVQVISVDQITYEEYIRSVPNPSVISVFDVGGDLKGNAVFEINPSLSLAMIDRLFGGLGKSLSKSRSLTPIEETVMKKIIARLLNDLTEAWQQFVSIEPKIELMESNPQFTQIALPNAMVLLVTFEVRINETEGTSNLCFPHIVLEPILEKLNVQYLYSGINKIQNDGNTKKIEDSLKRAKIPLVVELGRSLITVRDFLQLNVDDVIMLDRTTTDLLDVHAGGRMKFKGHPGLVDNKLSVAIAQVIRENEEVLDLDV